MQFTACSILSFTSSMTQWSCSLLRGKECSNTCTAYSQASMKAVEIQQASQTLLIIILVKVGPTIGQFFIFKQYLTLPIVKLLLNRSKQLSLLLTSSLTTSQFSVNNAIEFSDIYPCSYIYQYIFIRYRVNLKRIQSTISDFFIYFKLSRVSTVVEFLQWIVSPSLFTFARRQTSLHQAQATFGSVFSYFNFYCVLDRTSFIHRFSSFLFISGQEIIYTQATNFPQVKPLTMIVSMAIPHMQKTVNCLNLSGRASSTPTMRAKHIPSAPLSPPQTKTMSYFLETPQPDFLRIGQQVKTMIALAMIIKNQKINILIQSQPVIVDSLIIQVPTTAPVIIKMRVSQLYWMKDHTSCIACSLSGQIFLLPTADMQRPRVTILRMPETFRNVNSATQKQRQAPTTVTVTERTLSLMIRLIQQLIPRPKRRPRSGPPMDVLTKLNNTFVTEAQFPLAKSKNKAKKTMAVPSLSKDYPQTRVLNLTLAPSSFSKATTATGSVAERTQPRVNASYQFNQSSGYPNIALKQKARIIAPQSTPGAANVRIFTIHFLTTCHQQLKADSKIRVGMKINRIIWGCSLQTIAVESPMSPNELLKQPRKIPKTNNMGVQGNLYLLLTYLKNVPMSIPKMMKNITRGPLWLSCPPSPPSPP